jgi:hypothetical protein
VTPLTPGESGLYRPVLTRVGAHVRAGGGLRAGESVGRERGGGFRLLYLAMSAPHVIDVFDRWSPKVLKILQKITNFVYELLCTL